MPNIKKLLLTRLSCTCTHQTPLNLLHILHTHQILQNIQTHMSTRTTVLLIITRTQEPTLIIGHIPARRSTRVAHQVQLVTAPALAAVLDTGVVVVRTPLETSVDGHVRAVVEDLGLEETAG